MATNNCWNSQNPAQVARGGTGRANIPAHNLITGAGINAVNFVGPSGTVGIPLISNTILNDPYFSTAAVLGGGTGKTGFTAYSVVCAGTLPAEPLNNVAGTGTVGQVLTSFHTNMIPEWHSTGSAGLKNLFVAAINSSAGFISYTQDYRYGTSTYGTPHLFTISVNDNSSFSSDGIYTVPENGTYQFNVLAFVDISYPAPGARATARSDRPELRLGSSADPLAYKALNTYPGQYIVNGWYGFSNLIYFSANTCLDLLAGNTVSLWVHHLSASCMLAHVRIYFSGYYIHS